MMFVQCAAERGREADGTGGGDECGGAEDRDHPACLGVHRGKEV